MSKLAKSAWLGGSKRRKTWIDHLTIGSEIDVHYSFDENDEHDSDQFNQWLTGKIVAVDRWNIWVKFVDDSGNSEIQKLSKSKNKDDLRKPTKEYWCDHPELNRFKTDEEDALASLYDSTKTEAGPAEDNDGWGGPYQDAGDGWGPSGGPAEPAPEPQDPREPLILSRPPSSRKRKVPDRHQDQEYTGSYDGKKKKTGVEGKKPVE